MVKKVKNFVEIYNKNISWNKDILNNIDINFFIKNEETKKIIEEYLPIKTIDSENYDLENAILYDLSYRPGILELQAYSYNTHSTTYFWVYPEETEEQYKSKKINIINEVLDNIINKRLGTLKEISSSLENVIKLKNALK